MNTKKFLFYLLAVLLGGCIPVMSLHSLYTEEDVVFEEKLLGTWVDDANGTWEFKHPDEKDMAYELVLSSPEGTKGLFVANLVKLENLLLLDVYPTQSPCGKLEDLNEAKWFYNAFFFVPVHTFIKIDSIEPKLRMRLTDDERMEKLLKEDPNAIKYELADDKLILTASTKELQAFALKYADDSRLFSDEIVYNRKKPKSPQEPAEPNDIEPNDVDPNQTEPNSVDANKG